MKSIRSALTPIVVAFALVAVSTDAAAPADPYLTAARACADALLEHGTDRYGPKRTPILVSILDVETRECPPSPLPLDEQWRVVRRERRNPAGANLLADQALLRTLTALSAATGAPRYAQGARRCVDYYLQHLVDERGLFWWGWHRHYDVFKDEFAGHQGNHHEIHAINEIDWDLLWAVNPVAVRREIEALWQWHVIDKNTGEINRHADGLRGCDFSMSAGAHLDAFALLFNKTKERIWLERALLLADYYWQRRNPATNLFPERPNAGVKRFDGAVFVTACAGLHGHALLRAYQRSGERRFLDYARAYLSSYARLGYDQQAGQYWGALRLDGSPILGPREKAGYAAYEPRGHLDLWQPYAAGYEHPLAAAQTYVHAYALTGDPVMLTAARRFAVNIQAHPPQQGCLNDTWYDEYARTLAPQGTYAGNYGRVISFFAYLFAQTGEPNHLNQARRFADEALAKLAHKGLLRGHPAKPYYEAIDGVGNLLYALVQLHAVQAAPGTVRGKMSLALGAPSPATLPLDNF